MSSASERRDRIIRILCVRKRETVPNLANELNVSEKTIRRDIDDLSLYYPITTYCGRCSGGVEIDAHYKLNRPYFNNLQIDLLCKIVEYAEKNLICPLSALEIDELKYIIAAYKNPFNNDVA